jgi:hypothetical protein
VFVTVYLLGNVDDCFQQLSLGFDDPDPWVRDVLFLLWGLESRDEYRDDTDLAPLIGDGDKNEVRLGPEIPQRRLTAYSEQATG